MAMEPKQKLKFEWSRQTLVLDQELDQFVSKSNRGLNLESAAVFSTQNFSKSGN